jgi:hypothetical protein
VSVTIVVKNLKELITLPYKNGQESLNVNVVLKVLDGITGSNSQNPPRILTY